MRDRPVTIRRTAAYVVSAVLLVIAGATRQSDAQGARPPIRAQLQQIEAMAPIVNSDPRFGVVQAFTNAAVASRIGVRWERVTFWWKEMQPNGPGSWNAFATNHDSFINREVRAGRSIAGLLINTPDWAAVHPSQHGISVPRGLYLPYTDPRNYWAQFVRKMALHYKGRIDSWIIWNEVSIPSGEWHTWAGSRADYAQLVKVAYLAAHSVNPKAKIILAGDPYWYDYGAWFTEVVTRLAHEPGAATNHSYFDAANLHLYNSPTAVAPIVTKYRAVMKNLGLSKPIWLAETNAIPYNDPVREYPRAGFFATLDDQASYIVDVYALSLALGIQRIEVNRMTDGTDFTAGGEPLGLLRNDGSARPALFAYRTVAELLSHITHGTIHIDARTGVYTVTLFRPGAQISVLWDQDPVAATALVTAVASGATLYDKWGNPTTVHAQHGTYIVHLARATGNTNPSDPSDYVMGGSPQILIQQLR